MHSVVALLFYGPLITPQSRHSAKYLPRALLYVEDDIIEWIEEDVALDSEIEEILHRRELRVQDLKFRKLRRGEFLIPGFIDTHTHAPQFSTLGLGDQLELFDWLEQVIGPLEPRFADKQYAEKVYSEAVRRSLNCGTTTCCYFGTMNLAPNKVLANIVKASGQRAFIGHCTGDRYAPGTTQASIEATRAFISYINSLQSPLVRAILTPTTAFSCTDGLLKGLGDLAAESPHHLIQTHILEQISDNEQIARLFPNFPNGASVYDGYGLLGTTTILGHGCHLSREEVALIKKRGAGISHCPTSNLNLRSGISKVGEWLDEGVKVGLGTDVSAGFSVSMLTAINHASIASNVLAMSAASVLPHGPEPSSSTPKTTVAETVVDVDESAPKPFANQPLPNATLLYMATLGGAELCNLESRTGSLVVGKAFDALLVNLRPEADNPNIWWDGDDAVDRAFLEASLEKLFFCGDDRNISAVWVEGKLVGGRHMRYVSKYTSVTA